MSAASPLSGLIVVELGTSVAGPFAGQVLADLGAEVFKVENPASGDDTRSWGTADARGATPVFNAINRNKRSVAIDLKDAAQRAALIGFIREQADIVLQNLRPRLVESYRLDGPSLRRDKPSLIYCNLTAYGTEGPLKDRPGYDPLMQAFGGLMSVTGEEGREPIRTGPSIIDQAAGMWAVIGILAALHRRSETGEGGEIGTSLYETSLNWVCMHLASFLASGHPPRRMGSENFGMAPHKAYEANDGWLVISAGNDKLFEKLATAMDRPEWASDPRFRTNPDRIANRIALNELIATIVKKSSVQHWLEKLSAGGIPCAPVLALDQVVAHPQFKAVGMLQDSPQRDMSLLGLPLQFDGTRPAFRSNPPALGADTALVLEPRKAAAK